jgi:hypothetical protein
MRNKVRSMRHALHLADKVVKGEQLPIVSYGPCDYEEKQLQNSTPHALQSGNMRHIHKKACNLYEKQTRFFHSESTGNTGKVKYTKKGIGYNSYTTLTENGHEFTRLNGFEYVKANDPQYELDQETRKLERESRKQEKPILSLVESDKKQALLDRVKQAQVSLAKSETISKDHL